MIIDDYVTGWCIYYTILLIVILESILSTYWKNPVCSDTGRYVMPAAASYVSYGLLAQEQQAVPRGLGAQSAVPGRFV